VDTCSRPAGMLVLLALSLLLSACGRSVAVDYSGPVADWPEYGGDKGGLRYSPLTQIDVNNVNDLELAWVYRHGDFSDGKGEYARTSFQATPIVVNDTLYFCTGFMRVIALDPETGRERWSFDPDLRAKMGKGPYPLTCRGVAYWSEADPQGKACEQRIFIGTRDSELIALDADTGEPCRDFGADGRVALREGLAEAPDWEYYPTSPPLVIRDVAVVGALVSDSLRIDAPSGVVRAFDVRTGEMRWAWDPVPPGWDKDRRTEGLYQVGTPNVWSILAGDEKRGLVFVPTGNPSPDMFGGLRNGLDYYGSSTVALDAESGRVVWHFQTVHHDVWDYDVASQPTLFQIPGVGGGVAAVAQATKMGHIFLLDRETGEPLYPVEERPVPQRGVPGETLSPTQPFPTHPAPLHPAVLTPDDAWGFTPIDRKSCEKAIASYRSEGIFTPPSLEGSIQYPSAAGGVTWGGVSIDPRRGMLFLNQMRAAMVNTLIPRQQYDQLDPTENVYPNEFYPMEGVPYGVHKFPLLSKWGAPCNSPPWGTLTGVNLRSGEVVWEVSLGTTRDQAPFPLWLDLGAPNLGGSIVTAGGVVFVAATTDKFIRGFDAEVGDEIWRSRIPFTGNATPMTYRLSPKSKQYLVLAAGGHGWSEPGDAVVAYALPGPTPDN
jgi:quinoprotein glucose dehydrogenase